MMGKKLESYQPVARFRLRLRSAHTNSGPGSLLADACPKASGWCWRCLLVRLPTLVALICVCIGVAASCFVVHRFTWSAMSASQDAGGSASTGLSDAKLVHSARIIGYWKEVRESFGLTRLPDTITWSLSALDELSADFDQHFDNLSSGRLACLPAPKPAHQDESEARLLRLGRFNRHMRRWRDDSHNHRSETLDDSGIHSESDCRTFSVSPASSGASDGFANDPNIFPELTISHDSNSSSREYSLPLLKIESLAASFRAIAARELRARIGVSHGSAGNYRMFRHLMG